MAFTNAVLNNQVGDLLARQFAASKGITISSADLATAKSDFESTLDGEISQEVQSAESPAPSPTASWPAAPTSPDSSCWVPCPRRCRRPDPQPGRRREAAAGGRPQPRAVSAYYAANKGLFTQSA